MKNARQIVRHFVFSLLFASLLLLPSPLFGQSQNDALEKTRAIVLEIAKSSYPEVKTEKLRFKTFRSDSAFFKARFSIARFFTFQKMRHLIYVNPDVYRLDAPVGGIRAILAHELAHVSYYTRKNRFELLALSRLASDGYTARFERRADLEAISNGFVMGLIEYRQWLYKNIPKAKLKGKLRNYFTPDELQVIHDVLKDKPYMLKVWRKQVPRNIDELKNSVK